jgi:hypothetical protein
MLIIERLTNMNEASKKNIMSINGMISIRAFLIGTGVLCLTGFIVLGRKTLACLACAHY